MEARELRASIVLLRLLVLIFAALSLALLATNKQTSSVPLPFLGLPAPIYIIRTARYTLVKGVRFFADTLALVVAYSSLHLLLNIGLVAAKRSVVGPRPAAWATFVADSAITYLLASATAVATEIGYLAEKGAPDVMWNKVCNYFGRFCRVYAASVIISFLATLASIFVVGISAYHLFRLYGLQQHQKSQLSASKTVADV